MTVRTNFICRGIRPAERRPHVPDTCGCARAPARGADRDARMLAGERDRNCRRRTGAPMLLRRRLRRPGGRPDRARQPRTVRVRGGWPPHVLANVGESGVWDGPRSARDLEAIVQEQIAVLGLRSLRPLRVPQPDHRSQGGLEHLASTVLMTSRWKSRTRKGYLEWLGLASHELFHAWNVKRLRPLELGPFDYEAENHTRGLWVAEGITDLLWRSPRPPCRTVHAQEYLDQISGEIRGAADDTRPSRSEPGRRLIRRLDQALPARRELPEHRCELLHEGCPFRLSARHRRFSVPAMARARSTM